ncbi:TlpA disulfide reductase family protein [Flavobacterium sp. MK4S-17]|uniref:TlpA family protein disulfide reductase n=1 Tax=Flavobacterium sp. MK4S-17 TaxID=2543737 RepID=UPI001359E809|nr:TlpA disulfide reductase family protein [Flavobacterium sp. MK4S-17]
MKKILLLPLLLVSLASCSQDSPTAFTPETLAAKMTSVDGKELTFKEVLEKHKGKVVVIDVWASWCPDCKKGMPKVHDLQKQFPNVDYVFLSYDRYDDKWKQGIESFGTKGDNYHVGTNMKKGAFSEGIKLDWIPRYMVVDKNGKIALFKAIEADDKKLIATLKKLQ